MAEVFIQLGVMIVVATLGAFVARVLKQPIIPAYILAGFLLGPVLKLVSSTELIKTMSMAGIAFLLFIVGLELAVKKIRDTGKVVILGGIIQMLVVFAVGFAAALFLGMSRIEASYLGLIVAFSSTMIVVKLLSDNKQLETLHGKIIIGILLVQDVVAIAALSLLASFDAGTAGTVGTGALSSLSWGVPLVKAGGVFLFALLCSKYIFPVLFRFAAKSQELLFMAAVSTCFFFSLLVYSLNISIAIGAFIAGLSLANLPYNLEIVSKVKSLKDFFSTLFFVSLGMSVVVSELRAVLLPLIVFVALVVVLKPFLILLTTSFFGYTSKVSFTTALSLAQVSEFSIILAGSGLLLGHLSNELFTLTIVLAVLTMVGTSYFIQFDSRLYRLFSRFLHPFDRVGKLKHLDFIPHKDIAPDAILIGYDRIGYSIFKTFQKMRYSFLVVDYNPDIVQRLASRKIPCLYGDISDDEILERINLAKAKLIISTVPSVEDGLMVIKKTRSVNHRAIVMVTANVVSEALTLYAAGADYVIIPHLLGGERVAAIVEEYRHDLRTFLRMKHEHLDDLKQRQRLEHEQAPHGLHYH